MFSKKPSGVIGWGIIFAVATAYDIYAIKTNKIETLSSAFWRWSNHPIGAIATVAFWAALTHHLLVDNQIKLLKGQQ